MKIQHFLPLFVSILCERKRSIVGDINMIIENPLTPKRPRTMPPLLVLLRSLYIIIFCDTPPDIGAFANDYGRMMSPSFCLSSFQRKLLLLLKTKNYSPKFTLIALVTTASVVHTSYAVLGKVYRWN